MASQKQPVVYKVCNVCKARGIARPVRSILLRKGRYFDDYLCLEPPEKGSKPHVFKVKTRLHGALETTGSIAGTAATSAFVHTWLEKGEKPELEESIASGSDEGTEEVTNALQDLGDHFDIEPSELLEIILGALGG